MSEAGPERPGPEGRERERMSEFELLPITADTPEAEAVAIVKEWAATAIPAEWQEAAARGGNAELRKVRPRADYEAWYPTLARVGLVAPMWPREYGGLAIGSRLARAIEGELAPFNLGRLNILGLNLAGPTILAWGTDEQKARFLPPIVRNDEVWCQLFSEPGAGSDLASLATRAIRDGDEWVVTGQKVWSTWAHFADYGMLIARTDPTEQKRKGITYFLLPMKQDGVEVRPLIQITGEHDFNEVYLDDARVPDANRIGDEGDGWKVANSTLSGERQMIAGPGSGGVDRIGGSGVDHLIALARERGLNHDPDGAPAARGAVVGGADPPVDEQPRTRQCTRRTGRARVVGREDRTGRGQPPHPGARRRPARDGRTRLGRGSRSTTRGRSTVSSAVARTRSRAGRRR